MALPFQPFYNFPTVVGKRHHPKVHWLDLRYQPKCERGQLVSERGCFLFPEDSRRRDLPLYASPFIHGEGESKPAFTAFDKQILIFWSYYKEDPIIERQDEICRYHQCKIFYYLEDDTMKIYEPWVKNSQMTQGVIVSRHRFPKPSPMRDQFYTPEDLNISQEIYVYGKMFRIVDCDAFTRDFLTKIGIKIGPPEEMPCDCYSEKRKIEEYNEPKRYYESIDKKAQFYKYNGRVLRFFCLWDDTHNLYGDKRYLILHYFLEDDTIEIIEQYPANCGRVPGNFFLRRCKVPKKQESLPSPGDTNDQTILNVFGSITGKFKPRFNIDPHKLGYRHIENWGDADLYVGSVVDVFGKKLYLYDCDDQTRVYYKTKYGIDNDTINVREPCPLKPPWVIPPNTNRIGSDEDTLGSIRKVIPKPFPRKDYAQFLQYDRYGTESYELKFFAKFLNPDDPVDRNRSFVISYFLSDDTIKIYEPARENSGFRGGLFLARNRIKKSEDFDPVTGLPYYWDLCDFYVGAVLPFYNFFFRIIDADEYCYVYLEDYPQYFPKSNVKTITEKLKSHLCGKADSLKHMLDENDVECTDRVDYAVFKTILRSHLPDESAITDHEIITMARYYGDRADPNLSLKFLTTLARSQLQKRNYLVNESCLLALQNKDRQKAQLLTPRDVYFTLRSCNIPIEIDLIKNIIARLPTSEKKYINYLELLDLLDWTKCPSSTDHPTTIKYHYKLFRPELPYITAVRYKEFMHDCSFLNPPIEEKI